MTCRTPDEAYAAGLADSGPDPPLSQDEADLIAAILAPHVQAADNPAA